MFADTARLFMAAKVRENEKQRRATRGERKRKSLRQHAERGDFAKREGEALERFAFGFLEWNFVHLSDFSMCNIIHTQAHAEASKSAPIKTIGKCSDGERTPKSANQKPKGPNNITSKAKKP